MLTFTGNLYGTIISETYYCVYYDNLHTSVIIFHFQQHKYNKIIAYSKNSMYIITFRWEQFLRYLYLINLTILMGIKKFLHLYFHDINIMFLLTILRILYYRYIFGRMLLEDDAHGMEMWRVFYTNAIINQLIVDNQKTKKKFTAFLCIFLHSYFWHHLTQRYTHH